MFGPFLNFWRQYCLLKALCIKFYLNSSPFLIFYLPSFFAIFKKNLQLTCLLEHRAKKDSFRTITGNLCSSFFFLTKSCYSLVCFSKVGEFLPVWYSEPLCAIVLLQLYCLRCLNSIAIHYIAVLVASLAVRVLAQHT